VRYIRFEQNRVLSFIPPDGDFQLVKYRVNQQFQPPVYCKPQIVFGEQGGKVTVMVGPKSVPSGKVVEELMITIPFSKSVSSTNLTCSVGSIQFDESTKILKWDIGKLPMDKSLVLNGSVSVVVGSPLPSPPSLHVDFKINGWTISGLKIDNLLLVSEKYKPFKGVRMLTKAGKFQVRGV